MSALRVAASIMAFGLSISLWAAPGSAESGRSAEAAIRAALERWTEDFNAGNAEGVCDLFAPDLVSSYQGQPERGYEELCALLQGSLNDPERSYRYTLDIEEIIVSGDLGVVRLVWFLEVRTKGGPAGVTVEEPGIDIFRRQPDGAWRIARYLAYPVE